MRSTLGDGEILIFFWRLHGFQTRAQLLDLSEVFFQLRNRPQFRAVNIGVHCAMSICTGMFADKGLVTGSPSTVFGLDFREFIMECHQSFSLIMEFRPEIEGTI